MATPVQLSVRPPLERMSGAAARVSILIVHHETPELLDACLDSIAASPLDVPHEILVIDNASDPPLPAGFESRRPGVRLVRNPENIGYSRAVNQGVRAATGEFLLILNPDIEIQGDAIGEMVRFMDGRPDAGIVGCRLLNPDGSLQYSCRTFYDWKTLVFRRSPLGRIFPNSGVVRRHLMMDWDHDTVREVDWLIGACLLVRREAIRKVGLMDERFFMYFEDVDWCFRMAQGGFKVFYLPSAQMKHHHRRASTRPLDRRFVVHLLSMLRFADKWNAQLWRIRKNREAFATAITFAVDLLAANLAFLVAFSIRNLLRVRLANPVFPIATYAPFILYMTAILAVTFVVLGVYKSRVRSLGGEAVGPILRASFVAYLILTLTTFLSREIIYSRLVILAFFPLEIGFVLLLREGLRRAERTLRRNAFDLRRVVVLGEGAAADEARATLQADPDLRYELVGGPSRGAQRGERFEELPAFIEAHRIHEVVLGDPAISRASLERFLLSFPRLPVGVSLLPGLAAPTARHAHAVELGEQPLIVYEQGTRFGIMRTLKRLTDLAVSAVGAVALSPFLLIAMAAALLRGRRPLERRRFSRFGSGEIVLYNLGWRGEGDPRSWLRLPRIYAVLTGTMSLVGIPPERLGRAGEIAREIPPGLVPFWTWARSAPPSGDEEWDRLARGYLLRWSPTFDLSIVLRALLRGSGW